LRFGLVLFCAVKCLVDLQVGTRFLGTASWQGGAGLYDAE